MATKKVSPPQRIDADFEHEMRAIARIRLDRNLANLSPRDLSLAEMTRLLRKTNGYQISLEELKTKPKKK
jgi:hypothetical protein